MTDSPNSRCIRAFLTACLTWAMLPAIAGEKALIFSEDFSGGSKVLKKWKMKDRAWWTVNADGQLQSNNTSDRSGVGCVSPRIEAKRLTASFDFNLHEGKAVQFKFNYAKGGHIGRFIVDQDGFHLQINRNRPLKITEAENMEKFRIPVEPGQWHRMEMTIDGSRVTGSLVGKGKKTYESKWFDNPIGVFEIAATGKSCLFDNIVIESLGDEQNGGKGKNSEWKPLFNGKNLDGWIVRSGTAKYTVKNGILVGTTVPKSPNTFLCTTRTYGDFELELDVNCDLGLNSGVQIRSRIATEGTQVTITKNPNKPKTITLPADRVYGYQVEIAKAESGRCGGVYDEARRFIFLDEPGDKPGAKTAFKDGEWNHYRIRCQGDRIRTWVNGVLCADVRDQMDREGVIGLQVHGNISVTGRLSPKPYEQHQIRFRNIRIREL